MTPLERYRREADQAIAKLDKKAVAEVLRIALMDYWNDPEYTPDYLQELKSRVDMESKSDGPTT